MKDFITVDVNVGEAVKSFICACNGSDLVVPERYSNLWCLVKPHLLLRPNTWPDESDRTGLIRLQLYNSRTKSYSIDRKEVIFVDTLYRCYLDETGQRVVTRYFTRQFKLAYHMWMKGAAAADPGVKVCYATAEFLLEYNVDVTARLLEMLQKDWYRYRLKEDGGLQNPLCY